MPSLGHFLDLLEAVSRRDWKTIEQIGKRVAEEERKKKHYSASHQLMEAVEVLSQSGSDKIGTVSAPSLMPTSAPPELLHSISEKRLTDFPILNPVARETVDGFLSEWRNESKLRAKGIEPRRTLLLHGPPGCGKTLLASYIAKELKLKLFLVRFDTMISSFLGETGQNIRKVFDYLASNRCALLIDELDAIAKLRDDRNELGELKRIVISLLQNIDLGSNRSLLIAATNHPHVLDPAIWRRFEVVLELTPPAEVERQALIERFLENSISKAVMKFVAETTAGWSGSDLEKICLNARRKSLLENDLSIDESILLSLMDSLRHLVIKQDQNHLDSALIKIGLELRELRSSKYSFNELEKITGIPKSTLHHKHKALGTA